jgi:hypothetical protein
MDATIAEIQLRKGPTKEGVTGEILKIKSIQTLFTG